MLIAFFLVFISNFRGVTSEGGIFKFSIISAAVILFVLGITGFMMENSEVGIRMYLYGEDPKTGETKTLYEALGDIKVWADAFS